MSPKDKVELVESVEEVDETKQETGEKEVPSSPEVPVESPETDTLKSQLDALTKELSRVRKGKAESSAEVQELREQLANVRGQLEVMAKGSKGGDDQGLTKYSDEQLLQGQTEWEDELYELRDTQRRARSEADEAALSRANKAYSVARGTLSAIRKELMERTKRVGVEQAKAQTEASEMVQEIAGLYEHAYEAFPELKDKDSELWKAGQDAFKSHPKLMKQLGLAAEIVATAIALTENPHLLTTKEGKKVTQARKDLLTEINDRAEKSLIKGAATTNKKSIPDFGAMPKDEFEAMIRKYKGLG